jgi:hypothetical protein
VRHLNARSVWHDEAGPSGRCAAFTTLDDNTLPLFHAHLLWKAGAGESPLAFDSIGVIGLATVALAVRIARRWYGLVAGIMLACSLGVSPLLWEYSQEARPVLPCRWWRWRWQRGCKSSNVNQLTLCRAKCGHSSSAQELAACIR